MPDDHAGVVLRVAGSPVPPMTALAVDLSDSRRLYAVIQGVFHESGDWGVTWRPSHTLPGGGRRIFVDPQSPARDRRLYVVGASNVTIREGGLWKAQPGPANVAAFLDVSAGLPSNGGLLVIYGLTASNLYVSIDGGAEWTEATRLGEGARLRAVATSLSHPHVAYLS
ncbi:MAG: hypothetical protein IH602_16680 [Bryobacteraceae bacterium]|nr:hypothetical protein [Bryobacteraceae bacterium]